jgi:hypothetical protein
MDYSIINTYLQLMRNSYMLNISNNNSFKEYKMAIKLNETILTCAERDKILLDEKTRRPADNWSVESGFTDMIGEFGDPRIETTWEYGLTRIKDIRHPNPKSGKDLEPGEHYRWIKEEEEEEEE